MSKCETCKDCGWVCEEHPGLPWDGDQACGCSAPGAPCPVCNATNDEAAPRMPAGFKIEIDKDGWRQ